MASESAPKRSRRGRIPRQFSEPMLSDEQTKAMLGRPKRLKPQKPVLPALDLIDHRLTRSGRQEFLVGWLNNVEPSWESIDDISPDLVDQYISNMVEGCPLMPPGTDLSYILSSQMKALMFELQMTLKSGFAPFKMGRPQSFQANACVSMVPEVFLHVFKDLLPPETTPRSLLVGAKLVLTLEQARAVLDPYLKGWHHLTRVDGFASEIDPTKRLTFTYRLKCLYDSDHSADFCLKCSHPWTLADIVNRIPPTKCTPWKFIKHHGTFINVAFTHHTINGTQFYRNLCASSSAAAAEPAEPVSGGAAGPANDAEDLLSETSGLAGAAAAAEAEEDDV